MLPNSLRRAKIEDGLL